MLEIINDNLNLGKWLFFVKVKLIALKTDWLAVYRLSCPPSLQPAYNTP
jgi:hypothetical protein